MHNSSPTLTTLAASAGLMLAVQAPTDLPAQPVVQPGAPESAAGPAAPGMVGTVQAPPKLTAQQLDEMLGPIALYPDPLIAQILPASTYPVEVVRAARWVRAHPDLAGIDDQDWDPSVQAVARYSSIITMMDENLEWTVQLGQAFLNQQQDVMNSIQQLRVKAQAIGSLRDTPQQQVVVEQEVIRIVPAEPEVIYVPVYDPRVVYVQPYPGYIGYYPYVSFGLGFSIGWWLNLDCDWHHRHLYYHGWYPNHHDGDPFRYGHGPPYTPHNWQRQISGPGHEGDIWRHNPGREPPTTIRPRGHPLTAPTDPARGRLGPNQPTSTVPTRPGTMLPGTAHPGPTTGPPTRPTTGPPTGPTTGPTTRPTTRPTAPPTTTPGVAPTPGGPRPGAAIPVPPKTGPTQPTAPVRTSPNAVGGYQRGSQTELNSQRGQTSRGVAPPPPAPTPRAPAPTPMPAPRPTVGPRPTAPPQPAPAPRAPTGAMGGYKSGGAAAANSQRGNASRGKP